MRLELAISIRYFRSRRSEGAISFITLVAVLGVMLGVAALVVAMAVMNGYQSNLVRAMAGSLPHVSLHPLHKNGLLDQKIIQDNVDKVLGPTSISAFALQEALVQAGKGARSRIRGVMLRGIDPLAESRRGDFLSLLHDGSDGWGLLPERVKREKAARLMAGLTGVQKDGAIPVLLSPILARILNVKPGDHLSPLLYPQKGEGFNPRPVNETLVISGFFETGIVIFDELVLVMDLNNVSRAAPNKIYEIALGLRLQNPLEAGSKADLLRDQFNRVDKRVVVYSWLESNQGLFQVIRFQKAILFIVLMMIVIIAFAGMFSALSMVVAEKTKEIAILKSIGLSARSITAIFLGQGLMIGVIGTLLGIGLGVGVCFFLETFPLLEIPAGVYPGTDRIPVRLALGDILMVVSGAMVVCLIATWLAALRAKNLRPVESMRYG